ncbi:MAG: CPBP family intramembrane glutamic endopeptidase [Pseudomonadota bacterium]
MHNPDRSYSSRPAWVVTILVIGVFWGLDTYDWTLFKALAAQTTGWDRTGAVFSLRYLPQLLVPLAIGALLFGPSRSLSALGLTKSLLVGVGFGLLVTSIMLAAIAATSPFNPPTDLIRVLVNGALMPGVFEEIFYRAFLFGFLFRFAGWGFLPAALLGALIFGAGHLYQSSDPQEAAAIFAITAFGGVWFAWLYSEWDFNIWVPASIHVLMNGWWELFSVSETAMGPMAANISRLVVIVVSVLLTVMIAKHTGRLRIRGRAWLWGGPADRP